MRDDATNNYLSQQVANPFAGLLPGTNINGANVARSQLLRPYPQFTGITALETNGTSDYTSFQSRLERRMVNGFTVQVAYTWSKTMTETGYLNAFDQEPERVIGPFDRTHVFVASGIYELPFGRGRHWGNTWSGLTEGFLGGWQISSLFRAQSGAPLGFGNFLFLPGFSIDDVALSSGRDENKWFNVDPFNRVTAQQLVSNVRTQPSRFDEVRGPGYAVLDLGVPEERQLQRAHEAAAARRDLQRARPREPGRSQHDPDRHRVRDHHRPERSAAPAPAGGATELLAVHIRSRVREPGSWFPRQPQPSG